MPPAPPLKALFSLSLLLVLTAEKERIWEGRKTRCFQPPPNNSSSPNSFHNRSKTPSSLQSLSLVCSIVQTKKKSRNIWEKRPPHQLLYIHTHTLCCARVFWLTVMVYLSSRSLFTHSHSCSMTQSHTHTCAGIPSKKLCSVTPECPKRGGRLSLCDRAEKELPPPPPPLSFFSGSNPNY